MSAALTQAKRDTVNTKMFLAWDGQQHTAASGCNNILFCYSGVITPQVRFAASVDCDRRMATCRNAT